MNKLPFELVRYIFSHLDYRALWQTREINTYFKKVAEDIILKENEKGKDILKLFHLLRNYLEKCLDKMGTEEQQEEIESLQEKIQNLAEKIVSSKLKKISTDSNDKNIPKTMIAQEIKVVSFILESIYKTNRILVKSNKSEALLQPTLSIGFSERRGIDCDFKFDYWRLFQCEFNASLPCASYKSAELEDVAFDGDYSLNEIAKAFEIRDVKPIYDRYTYTSMRNDTHEEFLEDLLAHKHKNWHLKQQKKALKKENQRLINKNKNLKRKLKEIEENNPQEERDCKRRKSF